jgi:hypothetical protein
MMKKNGRRVSIAAAVLLAGILIGLQAGIVAAAVGSRSTRTGPIYSSTEAVEYAQNILVKDRLLDPGSFTRGERDRATIEALRDFQRSHYLRPTGLIDPETMGLLSSHDRMILAEGPVEKEPAEMAQQADRETAVGAGDEPEMEPAAEEETVALSAAVAPERSMPVTGSPMVLTIILGGILLGVGAALLVRTRS